MSTTTKKKPSRLAASHRAEPKASRSQASGNPPHRLRIREELLPESARYITIDDVEYVAMPVADFGDWYEDALDGAVADHIESLGEEPVPAEEVFAQLGIKPKKR